MCLFVRLDLELNFIGQNASQMNLAVGSLCVKKQRANVKNQRQAVGVQKLESQ